MLLGALLPRPTPEQVLEDFFAAWASGEVAQAKSLLLRPERLWDRFGADVRSVRLVAIRRSPTKDFGRRNRLYQVVALRATFDAAFVREGSIPSGRSTYTYFLARKYPWSPWRIADWTTAP